MVTMSQKAFQRVKVIENAAGGRLSVRSASRPLQLSERQVQRLKCRYQPDSVSWVRHGNRGRSMPWAVSVLQKQLIVTLARGKYQGFNDSHLAEKLRTEENLTVSRETVRRILRAAKLASPQKRRSCKYRSRRPPRPRFGMMALTDASRHDWLEGRGPQLTLIGLQDDATAQILAAHFQLEAENTVGYLRALHATITAHGIPLSLYHDRHSIFQRNDAHWTLAEQLAGKQVPTQLGRALDQLGIQQIPAYSPRAKGRIERAWRTCQDRLVSELRSPAPPPCPKPTPCSPASVPTTTSALPAPPSTRLVTSAPCRAASIWPAASARTTSVSSQPITPSPWARSPSPCHPCPAIAVTPVKWSNSRITWRACCASIEEISCFSRCLCRSQNTPNAGPCLSAPRKKENRQRHASTTSPAAPLSRPLLKR
jgi:transposase